MSLITLKCVLIAAQGLFGKCEVFFVLCWRVLSTVQRGSGPWCLTERTTVVVETVCCFLQCQGSIQNYMSALCLEIYAQLSSSYTQVLFFRPHPNIFQNHQKTVTIVLALTVEWLLEVVIDESNPSYFWSAAKVLSCQVCDWTGECSQ